jgi:Beta-lactamase enzyme family
VNALTVRDEFLARFRVLAPWSSFLAAELRDGRYRPVFAFAPDQCLAVASAFKLYILGALAYRIMAQEAEWETMLAIREDWKGLPLSALEDDSIGVAHPLYYYARQMIARGSNTASDHLLFHLGREAIESSLARMGHRTPARNMPFLSTREAFALKVAIPAARLDAYLASPVPEKRQFLAKVVDQFLGRLPDAATLGFRTPVRIDSVEWFASAGDLCRALATLKSLSERPAVAPLRTILAAQESTLFDPATWNYVGFKAGFETGVLSLSWLLCRIDQRWFVVSAILNDPEKQIDIYTVRRILQPAAIILEATP